MSQHEREPTTPTAATPVVTAGALLRAARERAGLSLDAVAQQLKLSPRQVKALEDDDFARLPGRTFVRGFARNYARLAKLDPDVVLAALPGGNADAGLAAPTLHATSQSIGELPVPLGARASWTRWTIPLTLIAIIAAGAAYELLRSPPAPAPSPATPDPARESVREAPTEPKANGRPATAAAPAPVEAPTAAPAPATAPGTAITTLPNPVAPAAPATDTSSANATSTAGAPTRLTSADILGPQPGDRELVLTYRDHSWTEVRDRNGRLLLSAMMPPGSHRTLSGQPPFELVIGNASDVMLAFDGKPVDLVPHTRQSVARLTLQ